MTRQTDGRTDGRMGAEEQLPASAACELPAATGPLVPTQQGRQHTVTTYYNPAASPKPLRLPRPSSVCLSPIHSPRRGAEPPAPAEQQGMEAKPGFSSSGRLHSKLKLKVLDFPVCKQSRSLRLTTSDT